jgi:hypothetical protein
MTDNNVIAMPPPSFASAVAPQPSAHAAAAPPPPPPPADDGVSTAGWLREMREMRREQAKEREHQTDAFVAAMDRLGGRVDANIGEMRVELRRHLNVLVTTFIVSLVVLASLAGATVYVKGFGVTASSTSAPAAAPASVQPGETPEP